MTHYVDFDSQLANCRDTLFFDLTTRDDLKIPVSFWEYVDYLERCLWLHYKPPSAWKPSGVLMGG